MKYVRKYEGYLSDINVREKEGIDALLSMFKSAELKDYGYKSVKVDAFEWLNNEKVKGTKSTTPFESPSPFSANAFDSFGEVKEYIEHLKSLGANNIKVGGFTLSKGTELYAYPHGDELWITADPELESKIKNELDKGLLEPEPDEYRYRDGVIRLWWD